MSLPIGTKCRLASGGPEMLVIDIEEGGYKVLCSWGYGEKWFPTVCLNVIRQHHIIDDTF